MDYDYFDWKWSCTDGYIDEDKIEKAGHLSEYLAEKAEIQKLINLEKEKEIERYGGTTKKVFIDSHRNMMYPDGGEEDDRRED